MAAYKYKWKCPDCTVELQLRVRFAQRQRKCPGCGFPISSADIDRHNGKREDSSIGDSLWNRRYRRKIFLTLLFGISILLTIFAVVGYKFLLEEVPVAFTSEFSKTGNVEFTYSNSQFEQISPLCGCFNEQDWDAWRGIVFTAREFELERHSDAAKPDTGFLVFSPPPAQVVLTPQLFKTRASYYLLEIPNAEAFDPIFILNPQKFPHYKVVVNETQEEKFLQIFTTKALKIALLGGKPLAALIPTINSKVQIKFKTRQFPGTSSSVELVENYSAETSEFDEIGDLRVSDIPTIDMLGPNSVIWTEDSEAVINSDAKILFTSKPSSSETKIVKVLVLNPPFATRIVSYPFNNEFTRTHVNKLRERNAKNANLNSQTGEAGNERDSRIAKYVISQRIDSGSLKVKISDPHRQSEEFLNVYNSISQKNSVTTGYFSSMHPEEFANGIMEFRFPPMPPNRGFNVFGPVSKFSLDEAVGQLIFGNRQLDIGVPSEIRLIAIQAMKMEKGALSVPLQLGLDDDNNKLQLRATAEISVNREPLTRRIDSNKSTVDYVVLGLTILGGAIAILSLIIAVLTFFRGR